MSCLADLPELIGFFSYSRDDDIDSHGALSELRSRIQGELRGRLGRTAKTFRLWQDKEAIASGTLWETEIRNAVGQSVFFIPIITPTVIASPFCKFELESFLGREAALGRADLIFPILYIDVPALEDDLLRQNDPVLSLIAKRQYADWREFRYLDLNSTEVKRAIGRFCADIRNALHLPWLSPEERREQEEEAARQRAEAERKRREDEARQREEDARKKAEQEAQERAEQEAEAKRRREEARERAEEEERRRAEQERTGAEMRWHAEADAGQKTEGQPNEEWRPRQKPEEFSSEPIDSAGRRAKGPSWKVVILVALGLCVVAWVIVFMSAPRM